MKSNRAVFSRNTARIVARFNGVGIARDVDILNATLASSGFEATFSKYRSIHPFRRWFGAPQRTDALIFLERVASRWLGAAGQYMLIPNQERFPVRQIPLLRKVDLILCKTKHAADVFTPHHPGVRYLGFTSVDRRLPGSNPDYERFFHLGGGSAVKGTRLLVDLWRRHPEWPLLTVVWHRPGEPPLPGASNVRVLTEYLPDGALRQMQNACGVHVCPSLSEGWGHYIAEAASCAAVAVVTDGPPMNELITSERGVLVPHSRVTRRKLGFDYHVSQGALETAIESVLAKPVSVRRAIGEAAREWFEANDQAFFARAESLWSSIGGARR